MALTLPLPLPLPLPLTLPLPLPLTLTLILPLSLTQEPQGALVHRHAVGLPRPPVKGRLPRPTHESAGQHRGAHSP